MMRTILPAMMRTILPAICSVILVSGEPQTRHFHSSYYHTMIEGLGVEPHHVVGDYGGEEDRVGETEHGRREIDYESPEEAFARNNDVYDEYHEELADGDDYQYEEYRDNHDDSYHQNKEAEGSRLNNILYEDGKLEGREAPEEENAKESADVDIRQFTLMISKLLFRLAQM